MEAQDEAVAAATIAWWKAKPVITNFDHNGQLYAKAGLFGMRDKGSWRFSCRGI